MTLPAWINEDSWKGYEEMRRKIRKPMTDRAKQLIFGKLEGFKQRGFDPNEALDNSTMNSWTGVFEPKQMTNKPLAANCDCGKPVWIKTYDGKRVCRDCYERDYSNASRV